MIAGMDLPRAIVPPDAVACDGTAATGALRLDGDLRLDGAWVLDRYLDPITGVSAVGELLDRSWGRPMGLATATLGVRMAELLATRRWPDDLVVVAVPSARESAGVLARVVGHVLEREVHPALVSRRWRADASSTRRFAVRSRHVSDHVLLVDDVVRTGDTLAACAELLRTRGAVGVWAVAAAVEPVQGSHRVVPVRLHVATGRRSTAIRADVNALVPVTFDGRLLVISPEDGSHADTAGSTPPSPLIIPGPDVTLYDRELYDRELDDQEFDDGVSADEGLADEELADEELDDEELVDEELADEELMDAVASAFEAVAGLEALRSIVSQHSGDETLSIDALLSELLRSTMNAEGVDHDSPRSDLAQQDAARPDPAQSDLAHSDLAHSDLAHSDLSHSVAARVDVPAADDATGLEKVAERDLPGERGDAAAEPDTRHEVDRSAGAGVDPTRDSSGERGGRPVGGWRGKRRRQKPKPSSMR